VPEHSTSTLTIPGIADLEPIGRGGFGTVYSGWQEALHRQVAVKILSSEAGDADTAGRLQREGMAMGALSHHPNVVPVYATGSVDGRLYLVMPLLADGSLADQLASGPLGPREVVELGRGLADALAAAHEAGVLHRDVKPANVMRTHHGTYQLADFGVARFVDATQTLGGSVLATVAYAAPEVLDGRPATTTSDVYSLGATLHAALRGRPPFESGPDDAPIALAVRVLTTPPPDLRAAGVPSALAAVVDRAMAREPADRYPSAAALRDALTALDLGDPDRTEPLAAVGGEATAVIAVLPPATTDQVVPVTGAEPLAEDPTTTRPTSRRRLLAALVLLLLLVVTGAALVALTDDDGDGTADDQASGKPPATAGETSTTPTTAPETATTPEVATAAPAAAPSTTATPDAGTTSVVEAVRDYYALLDAGRIDEGWARLSPAYQERTGESSYRGFWQTIDGVDVLEAGADGDRADVTLRYTRTDGSTSTESVILELVRDEATGALLIDDYRLR
jgi:Protein kinase domain